MSTYLCNHCTKQFEWDATIVNTNVVVIWCGSCVKEHWHYFKIFGVRARPNQSDGPQYWEYEENIIPLKNIPHRDNIVE